MLVSKAAILVLIFYCKILRKRTQNKSSTSVVYHYTIGGTSLCRFILVAVRLVLIFSHFFANSFVPCKHFGEGPWKSEKSLNVFASTSVWTSDENEWFMLFCRWRCLGESIIAIAKHINTALMSQASCPYSIVSPLSTYKKDLKNVGPIRNEPRHANSPGVATVLSHATCACPQRRQRRRQRQRVTEGTAMAQWNGPN